MNIVAVAKSSESFSASDQSAYREKSAVTSNFIHPSEDYINHISTNLSFLLMSTQMMVNIVIDKAVDSDLGSSFKYCSNTNTIFSC